MRLLNLIGTLAVCLSAVVTGAEVVDLQKGLPIGELTKASDDYVYQVSGADLSEFSSYNRDHFTLLVVTSTAEQHGCEACLHWKKILRKVAQAWYYDYLDTNYLFIAEVDLVDQSNMPLLDVMQISTVPQIWLIPPTNIANEYRQESLNANKDASNWVVNDLAGEPHSLYELPHIPLEQQALQFADWLAGSVQKPILLRQENAPAKFITTFALTFLAIMVVKNKGPSAITDFISKSKVYQVLYFSFLYLLLGGMMFSFITPVPFLARNDKNEVIYISGGNSYQFGVEMVIVGVTYFVLGTLVLLLYYIGQYKVNARAAITSESTKGVIVLALAAALYFFSSVLSSICLRKDHEYPYTYAKLF